MRTHNYIWIMLAIISVSCGGGDEDGITGTYKQEMRKFVQGISAYAKGFNPDFIIIPQNGNELVTDNGDTEGAPELTYLSSIDGVGREDLLFGYDNDNEPTPEAEADYMKVFLDICENNNVEVLVTDYCFSHDKMDESYAKNNLKGYISFAAPERELNDIPDYPDEPFNVNSDDIGSLSEARNFLYLLNPEEYSSKGSFISALSETNYDILIIDMFFDGEEFTSSEVSLLKNKLNGGKRIVISYMSIGEAEDYRYYWRNSWISCCPPVWMAGENPDWEGNYKVRYWAKEWQNIIYGNEESYLKKIIDAGFDGVYLDIIDAYEYFE